MVPSFEERTYQFPSTNEKQGVDVNHNELPLAQCSLKMQSNGSLIGNLLCFTRLYIFSNYYQLLSLNVGTDVFF
jgi:hypothetical protein